MKKIAIEEHAKKQDLEHLDQRLRDMDEAGIDMQVLSFDLERAEGLSAPEAVSMARNSNDTLAGIIEKYPSRFSGFAGERRGWYVSILRVSLSNYRRL